MLALLGLFFVFAQSADLVHRHDSGLQGTFDCDICLKFGAGDDVAANEKPAGQFCGSPPAFFTCTSVFSPSAAVTANPPRAPPHA